jgi:hypothetical protein
MPCYHPIDAWRSAKGVFFRDTIDADKIRLPCGRCIGCRLERSRQWAVRLVHEKRFHDSSSFITLTYDEEHIPGDGSLNVKHFQDFMKRLRKSEGANKIRFFHAGEYGEKRGRPHYHAIIFGQDFLDSAVEFEVSDRGDRTFRSSRLSRLWPFGLNRVGEVTFESCAYVARYVTKKVTGPQARDHYERICERTGEIFDLKPEYMTCSKKPGIGFRHFEKYRDEIYPADEVISRGFPSKPPKYYDRMLEKCDPEMYLELKDQRECALALAPEDRTPDRLAVREAVKLAQVGHLTRRYEIG